MEFEEKATEYALKNMSSQCPACSEELWHNHKDAWKAGYRAAIEDAAETLSHEQHDHEGQEEYGNCLGCISKRIRALAPSGIV